MPKPLDGGAATLIAPVEAQHLFEVIGEIDTVLLQQFLLDSKGTVSIELGIVFLPRQSPRLLWRAVVIVVRVGFFASPPLRWTMLST